MEDREKEREREPVIKSSNYGRRDKNVILYNIRQYSGSIEYNSGRNCVKRAQNSMYKKHTSDKLKGISE